MKTRLSRNLLSNRSRMYLSARNAMKAIQFISAYPDALNGLDFELSVFVTKTPTRPSTEQERQKVKEWLAPCKFLFKHGSQGRDLQIFISYSQDTTVANIARQHKLTPQRINTLLNDIFVEIESSATRLAFAA